MAVDPYPLTFHPILLPKVWGGRRLAHWGKSLPPQTNIGESWELADLDSTAPGGGGGGAAQSVIANGPFAGTTLRAAMQSWGPALLGRTSPTASGGFPLLVKFLDAREHLSVQVHPSPAYAQAHPDCHLKTESWFVLEADPADGQTPVIFEGLRPGVGPDDLREAINNSRVPDVLRSTPAAPGACHTLPSGTIHALGAGVLVAEVQTPSDTTFRVYDWTREYNRKDRGLHVAESLACVQFDPPAPPTRCPKGQSRASLARTPHYTIDEVRGDGALPPAKDAATVLMVVSGSGSLESTSDTLSLHPGLTVLVPATCACRWTGPLRLLQIQVGLPPGK